MSLLSQVRLHQLEGFFYTGLTGGYTRAAEAMPYAITEPAVYQQVRKLERAVGVPLVETVKGRKIALTPEGRALHEFVAPFFHGLPAALERARRRALVHAGVGPAFIPLPSPAHDARRRRRERDGVVAFDVTGLVPGEPVRYGIVLRRAATRPALVRETCELLVAAAKRVAVDQ